MTKKRKPLDEMLKKEAEEQTPPEKYYAEGMRSYQEKDYLKASYHLQEFVSFLENNKGTRLPKNISRYDAEFCLADSLREMGAFDKALEIASKIKHRRVEERKTIKLDIAYLKGRCYEAQEKLWDALREYERVAKFGYDAVSDEMLADLHFRIGMNEIKGDFPFLGKEELRKAAKLGHHKAKEELEKVDNKNISSSYTEQDIYDKVKEILKAQLVLPEEQAGRINYQTEFVKDLNADSLDLVELTMEVEDQFKINIPDKDAEAIRTVGNAVKYLMIQKNLKK